MTSKHMPDRRTDTASLIVSVAFRFAKRRRPGVPDMAVWPRGDTCEIGMSMAQQIIHSFRNASNTVIMWETSKIVNLPIPICERSRSKG